jgi:serine/threonine protein kinase
MSSFHEAAAPVNNGEIEVLRRLRDALADDWYVVGNFEYPAPGGRWYECDAIALSKEGYGFLIETKAWPGRITGNDRKWVVHFDDGRSDVRDAPINLLTSKTKKLVSWLRNECPGYDGFLLQPLVVLVSDTSPELDGKSAQTTVGHLDLIEYVKQDPRTRDQRRSAPTAGHGVPAMFELLCSSTRAPTQQQLGVFKLDALEELRDDGTEVWRAHPVEGQPVPCRLKRYRLDSLASADQRAAQLNLAQQDARVLLNLPDAGVVVPLWGPPFNDGSDYVVVSRSPEGESVQELLESGEVDLASAIAIVTQMFAALATLHLSHVVHRNLRPQSVWVDDADSIRFSDFDFARLPPVPGVTAIAALSAVDPDFAAPEVQLDLSTADQRSDVYSLARVAQVLFEACANEGEPPAQIRDVIEACLRTDRGSRPGDASEVVRRLNGLDTAIEQFEIHDVLDDRYVVRTRDTGGGLTVVYRLHDTRLSCEFAGKFVRRRYVGQLDVVQEYQIVKDLPAHGNVSKPTFVADMNRVRRGPTVHTYSASFLLSPWVPGRSLDKYVDQSLPEARIVEILVGVLRGLQHLHTHQVLHRDIKPHNVIIHSETGEAVILDFNVSASAAPIPHTSLGTSGYRAPEIGEHGWTEAADLYAAAVTVIDLVAGEHQGAQSGVWLGQHGGWVSPGLANLLERLLDPDPGRRGTTARALEEAADILSERRSLPTARAEPPQVSMHGPGNPYVEKMIGLFSQSSVSNAGTRGLDAFASWLYVPTAIDESLTQRIADGAASLVIITGNAGDGKTAFIRTLESVLTDRYGAVRDAQTSGNGSVLRNAGHVWRTNWDGSQDQGGVDNDDVLIDFFAPFRGDAIAATVASTSVIAINEGRLVDFLSQHDVEFSGLRRLVDDLFIGRSDGRHAWLTVVNLNRRVLTLPGQRNIVQQLLGRLSDERMWAACAGCAAEAVCPSRSNAALFRHPLLGVRAAERLREVLDVVRLRGRLHITTRDLLSALSFVMVGNRTCAELIQIAADGDHHTLLDGHVYNRLFAASDPGGTESAHQDRLLAELAAVDVADTPQPDVDGELWRLGPAALPAGPADLERPDRAQLDALWSQDDLDVRLGVHRALRRKLFLEREDPEYLRMLPYDGLRRFLAALGGDLDNISAEVAAAITASEGLRTTGVGDDSGEPILAVRMVDDLEATDRSYVTRPAAEFSTSLIDDSATAEHVEYAPAALRFASIADRDLALEVDLDVFEALTRMRAGFVPSREDLRGTWLSLSTFKERLASRPSRQLLLVGATGLRTTIRVDDTGRITAEAGR